MPSVMPPTISAMAANSDGFLGFAAWNEKEIDRAARILGRIAR
jgi:hypothetical protein